MITTIDRLIIHFPGLSIKYRCPLAQRLSKFLGRIVQVYLPFFSLLPQRKETKERGHKNMLPIALAGAPPHFCDAHPHLSFCSRYQRSQFVILIFFCWLLLSKTNYTSLNTNPLKYQYLLRLQ
jgi:hypothetical protein